MLPAPAREPFDSPTHVFEVAWDGIRALAFVEQGHLRIQDSYGRDVTWRYPELQSISGEVNGSGHVIDGEIVVLDKEGIPQFGRLLRRLSAASPVEVNTALAEAPVVFQAFDILYRDGRTVMNEPLRTRKRMLRQAVRAPGSLSVPDYVEHDGVAFFEAAREHGLAGTVAKETDSTYLPGRGSRSWQISRVYRQDEFVVGGFTFGGSPRGSRPRFREPFASLLLGAYDRWQRLRFAGELGGGFDSSTQSALSDSLEGLTTTESPFDDAPPMPRLVFWCEPALVASVAYSEWSPEGRLQFPKFQWIRPDVPPEACRLPEPAR
jgi:bifunctional non-homologous end joining protein LigD